MGVSLSSGGGGGGGGTGVSVGVGVGVGVSVGVGVGVGVSVGVGVGVKPAKAGCPKVIPARSNKPAATINPANQHNEHRWVISRPHRRKIRPQEPTGSRPLWTFGFPIGVQGASLSQRKTFTT